MSHQYKATRYQAHCYCRYHRFVVCSSLGKLLIKILSYLQIDVYCVLDTQGLFILTTYLKFQLKHGKWEITKQAKLTPLPKTPIMGIMLSSAIHWNTRGAPYKEPRMEEREAMYRPIKNIQLIQDIWKTEQVMIDSNLEPRILHQTTLFDLTNCSFL